MIRVDWLITGLNIVGGAEVFTSQLVARLSSDHVQLRLITLRSDGELINIIKKQGIPVIVIGVNNKFNPLPLIHLYRLWRKSPPRILHTHLFHAGAIGRLLARCTGIRYTIVHQHGTENSRSAFRSTFDRITSGMVDRYIVPSNAVKDVLIFRERVKESKISVINYGVDPELHRSPIPLPHIPALPGVPIIGCVSRLVREKSHPTLIKALNLLQQQGVKFHAIMVGDGPERDNLQKLSCIYEVDNYVTWVGYQNNIPSWLSKFDIFVLPSAWEGLPISILEAMSAHLPVVATCVGGTPEAVRQDETGILVPPDNPESLSAALYQLLRDPALRKKMGDAGYARVMNNFSIQKTVDNILQLYDELTD